MPDRMDDERFHIHLEDIKEFAIFRVDPQGRIASWNEGARRLKGYTAEEIIGQPFAVLFTPEDAQAGKPEQEMREAAEKGVYQGEGVRVRKGGKRFDAEVTLRALSDEGGVHRGFVKVTRDISERKRTEAELRKRSEFEQLLIGIVSHDLRTPLTAISLGAALLLRDDELGTRRAASIGRILSSAERAQRMIGSLLDFTQARLGKGLPLQYSKLDLHPFVHLVVAEVELAHPGRKILYEASGEGEGEWDPDRIAQVLTNLLSNALSHGREEGSVRVFVRGEPDAVLLGVHNWGKPISPEVLPHIFEPMERGGRTGQASKHKSIGLGLYIVQQIALAHGGHIDVRSTEEEGTTFTVRLPRHPPARPVEGNGKDAPKASKT